MKNTLNRIKHFIYNFFISIPSFISKHSIFISLLIFALSVFGIIFYIIHNSKNTAEIEMFGNVITSSIKDLTLAFIPLFTLLISNHTKEKEFEHQKSIIKLEQKNEKEKEINQELANSIKEYVSISNKLIQDFENKEKYLFDYYNAYFMLVSKFSDKELKRSLTDFHKIVLFAKSKDQKKTELISFLDKYAEQISNSIS